jgi:type I restriction enzyme S subunit
MSGWHNLKLGDLVELQSGGTPSRQRPEYWNGELPWVSPKDMKHFRLYSTEETITEAAVGNGTRAVDAGTLLLVVRSMILAREVPLAITQRRMAFNQDIKAVLPKPGADRGFVASWFMANRPAILGIVDEAGHGTKRIQTDRLLALPVALPPLAEQQRIASILCAYDDLIALNRRRVALLEEMSRRLFDEWFVQFKFPGHSSSQVAEKLAKRLPDGWEEVPLSSLCERITDGAHHSPPSVTKGRGMASVKDMREWDFDLSECRQISENDYTELVRNGCQPEVGDILIAKDGANLNKHTFLVREERPLVVLSSIAILRPHQGVEREFLVALLKSPKVSAEIKGMKSGAAIPRIVLRDFKRLPVILPPIELRKTFEALAKPVHELCRQLVRSNANLMAQRDLLLPGLVSGELSVSAAERKLEAAA